MTILNYNNLAEQTNYLAGSPIFDDFTLYIVRCNIPGLNFSPPEIGGRFGAKLHSTADFVSYNNMSIDILVDEDFKVYLELMKYFKKKVRMDMGYDCGSFPFWIQVNNNKGNHLFKLLFTNCHFVSMSDFQLDSQSDNSQQTLTLEIAYDYYDIITEVDINAKLKEMDSTSIELKIEHSNKTIIDA